MCFSTFGTYYVGIRPVYLAKVILGFFVLGVALDGVTSWLLLFFTCYLLYMRYLQLHTRNKHVSMMYNVAVILWL